MNVNVTNTKCDYNIETPPHSDDDPTECQLFIHDIIDDIVSDTGIDAEATISCCDEMRKCCKILCDIIPKITLSLSTIKKGVALWSTGFMIDCEFTDGGHLGAECVNDYKVYPGDLEMILTQHSIQHTLK